MEKKKAIEGEIKKMEGLVREYKSMKALMANVLLDDGRVKDNDKSLNEKIQHLEDGKQAKSYSLSK